MTKYEQRKKEWEDRGLIYRIKKLIKRICQHRNKD